MFWEMTRPSSHVVMVQPNQVMAPTTSTEVVPVDGVTTYGDNSSNSPLVVGGVVLGVILLLVLAGLAIKKLF
jgi:hypothetical protein